MTQCDPIDWIHKRTKKYTNVILTEFCFSIVLSLGLLIFVCVTEPVKENAYKCTEELNQWNANNIGGHVVFLFILACMLDSPLDHIRKFSTFLECGVSVCNFCYQLYGYNLISNFTCVAPNHYYAIIVILIEYCIKVISFIVLLIISESCSERRVTFADQNNYFFIPSEEERLLNVSAENYGGAKYVIDRLPVHKYIENDAGECSVCKNKFFTGDLVETLPCFHKFHVSCVDTWLINKPTCPNCRLEIGLVR